MESTTSQSSTSQTFIIQITADINIFRVNVKIINKKISSHFSGDFDKRYFGKEVVSMNTKHNILSC